MDIKTLVSKTFLFDVGFPAVRNFDQAWLIISLGALAIGAVLWLAYKLSSVPVDIKYRHKLASPLLFMGLCGLVWYGLRYQQVRLLSARVIIILIAVVSIIWLVFVIAKMFKNYNSEKMNWEKQQLKAKYLPK